MKMYFHLVIIQKQTVELIIILISVLFNPFKSEQVKMI